MEVRKNLRKKQPPGTQQQQVPTEQLASEDEEVVEDGGDDEGPLPAIYIADDLTKHRATLAYKARVAKREHLIADTWVHDGNILIKKQAFPNLPDKISRWIKLSYSLKVNQRFSA